VYNTRHRHLPMSHEPVNKKKTAPLSSAVKIGTIPPIDMAASNLRHGRGEEGQRPSCSQLQSSAVYFQPINPHQRTQRHNVHVLFLADQRGDHFLNRLTSMIGQRVHKQGFCHTEIVIPDLETSTLACPTYLSSSIYNGETVTLTKTKTFSNPGDPVHSLTGQDQDNFSHDGDPVHSLAGQDQDDFSHDGDPVSSLADDDFTDDFTNSINFLHPLSWSPVTLCNLLRAQAFTLPPTTLTLRYPPKFRLHSLHIHC